MPTQHTRLVEVSCSILASQVVSKCLLLLATARIVSAPDGRFESAADSDLYMPSIHMAPAESTEDSQQGGSISKSATSQACRWSAEGRLGLWDDICIIESSCRPHLCLAEDGMLWVQSSGPEAGHLLGIFLPHCLVRRNGKCVDPK